MVRKMNQLASEINLNTKQGKMSGAEVFEGKIFGDVLGGLFWQFQGV